MYTHVNACRSQKMRKFSSGEKLSLAVFLERSKFGVLTEPAHLYVACGTVTVFRHDDLGGVLRFVFILIILITVEEEDDIGIFISENRDISKFELKQYKSTRLYLAANTRRYSDYVNWINSVYVKDFIAKLREDFDYVIIDCPPSLSMLTVNAMTTADAVLVPIQCEFYALEGLSQLLHTIDLVRERLNPKLEIEGIVFTMYDSRTNLSAQVVESVNSYLDRKVYKSIIPRNVRLAEAPSHGLPVNLYDPKSSGAEAYRNLAEEVMKKDKKLVNMTTYTARKR